MPDISFIVPVRNDAVRLERCLRSIRDNDYPSDRIEIVVGDNGSTDGSGEIAATLGATVLTLPGVRVSEVRNLAAARARGPILAFVDADHLLDRGWAALAAGLLATDGIGAVGAPYHCPSGATWVQRAFDRFRQHTPPVRDSEWLGSGNLAVRREIFEAIGGFDATLETCEDVDLCAKIRKGGHRLVIDERLHSVHYGDPKTLRGLFLGELWRGRDNLRVTFRHGLTLRDVPSTLLPIVFLALLVTTVAGLIVRSPILWLSSLAGLAAIIALRVVRLTHNAARFSLADLGANLVVGAVYETARAFALVMRATHKTRSSG